MNVEIIKDYINNVIDTSKTIRNVNYLNMTIKDFEDSSFEIRQDYR